MKDIIGDYEYFVGNINRSFENIGINAREELAMCDHFCYRVASEDRYGQMKSILEDVARNIGEVMVSGRLITTFEFSQPLEAGGWRIPCLELPAPKEGSLYEEGLEHAEFVVIGSLSDFQVRHRELLFNEDAMTKQINPELGLKMPEHNLSVKFHEIPLGAVVRLEKRIGIE